MSVTAIQRGGICEPSIWAWLREALGESARLKRLVVVVVVVVVAVGLTFYTEYKLAKEEEEFFWLMAARFRLESLWLKYVAASRPTYAKL